MPAFVTFSPNSEKERITDMQTSTIVNGKRNDTIPAETSAEIIVVIDGSNHAAHPGERLVDLINRIGVKLSQVCYHPQLGPIPVWSKSTASSFAPVPPLSPRG
jgi:hypothetical protein